MIYQIEFKYMKNYAKYGKKLHEIFIQKIKGELEHEKRSKK